MLNIPVRIGTSIRDEIEAIYDDITKRAYEIFLDRHGAYTLDAEDWLAAESQMLCKPEVEVTDMSRLFLIRIALRSIDPSTLTVIATPDNLVLQSIENAPYPRVFRAIQFPLPVNPEGVRAMVSKGKLFLIAPKSGVSEVVGVGPVSTATREFHSAQR